MGHFKGNPLDAAFNMLDVFDTQDLLGAPPFAEVDRDTILDVLREVTEFAEGPIADSFAPGDRNPPVFDPATSSVMLPDEIKRAWAELWRSEWWRMEAIPELGGTVVPRSLVWASVEQLLGANPSLQIYMVCVPFAGILWRHGNDHQKRIAELMVDRGWTSTMMLTEPEAGSDVGAGTTRAYPQPDGSWHLTGLKRFISSADHDLSENIVHLVLARPEGAGPGSKGLSLFIVPKYHVDTDRGELGERNGVFVTNLEKKMGLTASTTCEVRLGEDPAHPAVGYLLGDEHNGIAQMFEAIEHSRMFVGAKAVATLSTAYLHALDFAKTRIQSPDMTERNSPTAVRVPIIRHPEVRRDLMLIKCYVEGLRSLLLYSAHIQDVILVGSERGDDLVAWRRRNDLLLPIVKGVSSERATELLPRALQVMGGSGYLKDYPLEQYIRDSKIDTLYEGTTAIQGQDLLFRKIVRDGGVAIHSILDEIRAYAAGVDMADLIPIADAVRSGTDAFQEMVDALIGYVQSATEDTRNVYLAGQHATRLLMSAGDVLIGHLLLRQAVVATEGSATTGSSISPAFAAGKRGIAAFFAENVFPHLHADRAIVLSANNRLMDLDVAAF